MTYIETWIQSAAALAIAKTLLHSLWQASIAAFVLAACLRFVHTSHHRYAAACMTLVVIVAAAIGTFLQVEPITAGHSPSLERVQPGVGFRDPKAANGLTVEPSRFVLRDALPWITPVWFIGVLLFNVRHIASCVAVGRLRRRGTCPAPDTWQLRLNAIRSRLNIAKPVVLVESCLTQIPLVVGHVRPAILIPFGMLTGLTAEQVELVLMHELAHIRRRDYLINMLQTCIEGTMFYNPAVWWISKTIRMEREHCCDDVVVETTNSAHAYATALAALEENRSSRAQLALAATGGNLVKRIRRVLHQAEPQASPLLPMFCATVLIVVIAGLLAARPAVPQEPEVIGIRTAGGPSSSSAPVAAAPAPPEFTAPLQAAQNPIPSLAPRAPQNAYELWLEEDVLYIISDEERAAFLNLFTNEERNKFVAQFWQWRDPTPGTAENEFRDEHYRRIAYANANFGAPSGFGWTTDRGRTYIQWGPPDELEDHGAGTYVRPDGTTQPFASQFWLYAYIEGIGTNVLIEFADPKGIAEYDRVTDRLGR